MATKLNKTTYENEIDIHISELQKHMKEDTLERRFIIKVLKDSVKCYYPECGGKSLPTSDSALNLADVIRHVCPECKGYGNVMGGIDCNMKCPSCKGSG